MRAPEMPLALPRRGAQAPAAKSTRDLTEHVWAGAEIKLTLKAVDDAGHEARSETKTFVAAGAAVLQSAGQGGDRAAPHPGARRQPEAARARPDGRDHAPAGRHVRQHVALSGADERARTRCKLAENDEALRDVVSYLWQIALGIEDGDLSAAEKRLRQAQQALKDALERGASDEEIDKLMKELRQAMDEFLREFAERAQKNPNLADQMQPGQELRQSDIDRLMDQIENLAKSGNREQAQELLSQLENMMNNLQAGRQQQRGQNGQQSEMRKQMDKLGEIMRRQQEMMNETFRMDQMQRGQRQRGQDRGEQLGEQNGEAQPGDQQGQGDGMSPEEFAEALKQLQEGQGNLRSDLEGLMKGLKIWASSPARASARPATRWAMPRPRSAKARATKPSASRAGRWKRCARAPRT